MPTSPLETSTPIISTEDLQAYYPLHENTSDESGNNSPSTSRRISFAEKSSSIPVAGFTTSGAYLMPTFNSVDYVPNFSIAGWVYLDSYDSIDGPQYQYGTAFGWLDLLRTSGKVQYFFAWSTGADPVTSNSAIPLHTWTHVSVTYKRSENVVRIYLNGELDKEKSPILFDQNTPPTTPPPSATPAVAPIGGPNYGPSAQYSTLNGYLCELYVYTRQLSLDEVNTLSTQNWGQDGAADNSWLGDTHIPNTGISYSPASVEYKDQVLCFHQGGNNNQELWFNTYNGSEWLGDVRINHVSIYSSPSVVVFNNQVYCFFQGTNNRNELFYIVYDGTSWTDPEQVPNTMSTGTSVVVYNGLIYCFHQGYASNNQLWYNTFDGTTWGGDTRVANTGISHSPSAIVYNNKVYCFHQGDSDNGQLWYNVFDGTNWEGDQMVARTGISQSPSAIVFEDQIYCFHQGHSNNGSLWYNVFDGTEWLGDEHIPNTGISQSPSALVYTDEIYCFHQGHSNNGSLWYNVYGV